MNSGDAPPARKPTPLPWGPLVWVCLVQFLDAFSTFLVVPFIPFMIRDFFPELPASEVGYYSGVPPGTPGVVVAHCWCDFQVWRLQMTCCAS